PASLPVRLEGAVLDLDLTIAFEQSPEVAVKLSGTAQAHKVQITDRERQPLLAWDRLSIALTDVRPLEHVVRLGSVELDVPVVNATRNAAGVVNLAQLAAPTPSSATAKAAASPVSAAAASAPPTTTASQAAGGDKVGAPKAPVWAVSVAQIAVREGTVRWTDQATQPAAALEAAGLSFDASDLALPFQKPFPFHGTLGLQTGTLAFEGEASDQMAQVKLSLNGIALQLAAPYLAQTLEPALTGQLSGDMSVQWDAEATGKAGSTGLTLGAGPLALTQLALKQGKTTLASVGKIALDGAKVELDGHAVDIERLAITQPSTAVERSADGHWMFERWLKAAPANATSASAPAAAPAQPWRVLLGEASVEGGNFNFADHTQPRPVALKLADLSLQAQKLNPNGSQAEALTLSARVGSGKGEAGKLSYRGTLTPQPLATKGRLETSGLPLHALDGYLADQLAIELLHGEAGFRGDLAFSQSERGSTLALSGDAAIDKLRAVSTGAATAKTASQVGEELLAWKSLGLRGLSVALAPGIAPRVEVKETSLADFYARLSLDETGRFNLDQLVKTPGQPALPTTTEAAAPAPTAAAPVASAAPAVAQA
ncbi:MAG: DUF748 domain-containing protein, partial [Giesbergeria sp.]